MKIWQKIIVIASCIAVLVCSLCVSGFAYVADFGTGRFTTENTLPYNVAIRFGHNNSTYRWLSVANTPLQANTATEDMNTSYNFYQGGYQYSAYVECYNKGKSLYIEPWTDSGAYAERVAFYYNGFYLIDANDGTFTTISFTGKRASTSHTRLELRYKACYNDYRGNLAWETRTKLIYVDSANITPTLDGYSYTFAIDKSDFIRTRDVAIDVDGETILEHRVYTAYDNIVVTALGISNGNGTDGVTSITCDGRTIADVGIGTDIRSQVKIEEITPDLLEWLAVSIDTLFGAHIVPPTDGFGGVTIGGLLLVVISIPLVVSFLKLFAGG